ncbi:hypothetical protein [Tannerella forsythia]|uniref:Uncharacterized protein n=1 Tax=Tannerella forsythia TaxID=28112 RepID=A0A3P1YG22_TANFO|nr:hypothetical protein [Tannerella forsythia]RRD68946.1 hypothetical protein EII41_13800 [Tannerella forsythia]
MQLYNFFPDPDLWVTHTIQHRPVLTPFRSHLTRKLPQFRPQFGRSFAKTPFFVTFYRRIVPLLPNRHLGPFLRFSSRFNRLKYNQKDNIKRSAQEAAPAHASVRTIKTPYKNPTTTV